MKRSFALVVAAILPALAGKMTITGYGLPHSYPLLPTDIVTLDDRGLYATVSSVDSVGKVVGKKVYFLGYSNKVTFSATGESNLTRLLVNTGDGQKVFDFSKVDSLTFTPQVDSIDFDGDGLTDFQELVIHHTNPMDKDSDGDGLTDFDEAIKLDRNVYSPLVANIPRLAVRMATPPRIFLKTDESGSQTTELTQSSESSWGEEDEVTESETEAYSYEVGTQLRAMFGISAGTKNGVEVRGELETTSHFNFTRVHEHSWGGAHRSSFTKTLSEAKTLSQTRGWTLSGGKLTVPVIVDNVGTVGFTGTDVTFTIYGEYTLRGKLKTEGLCTAEGVVGGVPLGASTGQIVLTCDDLTLSQVEMFGRYERLKVGLASITMNYTLEGNDLMVANTMTAVEGRTARISVDFGAGASRSQESPMTRQVAAKTKWIPETQSYEAVYLGEALSEMGIVYTFDSLGFKSVNGHGRDKNNLWWCGVVRSKAGGIAGDTLELKFGNLGGPDSVVVYAGDQIFIVRSGDDDEDGVLNATEKMWGIYDSVSRDYDADGISDSLEIYGWTRSMINPANAGSDTTTYFSNPKLKDSDFDGLLDPVDPYPLVPVLYAHSALLKVLLLDGDDEVYDSLVLPASDTAKNVSDTLPVLKPWMNFKVVVDTMPSQAYFRLNGGAAQDLLYDRSTGGGFVLKVPNSDSSFNLDTNKLVITLVSADGSRTRNWTLVGKSTLAAVTGLRLFKNDKRDQILVSFDNTKLVDPRVDACIVLRGVRSDSAKLANLSLPDDVDLTTEMTLGGFDVVADLRESYKFTDAVGAGSPYYAYRVFAKKIVQSGTKSKYFYAGSDVHVRSVGRIMMHVRFPSFAGNDANCSGGGTNCDEKVTLKIASDILVSSITYTKKEVGVGGNGDGETGLFCTYASPTHFPSSSSYREQLIPSGDFSNWYNGPSGTPFDVGSRGLVDSFIVETQNSDQRTARGVVWSHETLRKSLDNSAPCGAGSESCPANNRNATESPLWQTSYYLNALPNANSNFQRFAVNIRNTKAWTNFHIYTWYEWTGDGDVY